MRKLQSFLVYTNIFKLFRFFEWNIQGSCLLHFDIIYSSMYRDIWVVGHSLCLILTIDLKQKIHMETLYGEFHTMINFQLSSKIYILYFTWNTWIFIVGGVISTAKANTEQTARIIFWQGWLSVKSTVVSCFANCTPCFGKVCIPCVGKVCTPCFGKVWIYTLFWEMSDCAPCFG